MWKVSGVIHSSDVNQTPNRLFISVCRQKICWRAADQKTNYIFREYRQMVWTTQDAAQRWRPATLGIGSSLSLSARPASTPSSSLNSSAKPSVTLSLCPKSAKLPPRPGTSDQQEAEKHVRRAKSVTQSAKGSSSTWRLPAYSSSQVCRVFCCL